MADLTVSTDIDTLLQSGSNAAARSNLGLLSAATTESTDYATAAQGTTADNALQADAVGVSVQAYSSVLTARQQALPRQRNQAGRHCNRRRGQHDQHCTCWRTKLAAIVVLNAVSLSLKLSMTLALPVATTFYIIT